MSWSTILRHGALLTLLCCPTGCAIQMTLPENFLELDKSSTQLRATSADDTIFWVERFALPKQGQKLQFWVDALKNDFVGNRGYTLVSDKPTRTKGGVDGTMMEFEATTAGRSYRYLVALFMDSGPSVVVARFTAEKEPFTKHIDSILESIRSLVL